MGCTMAVETKETQMNTEPTFESILTQHLLDRREQIVADAVKNTVASIQNSLKWTASDQVQKEINDFFSKEVGPAISAHLTVHKAEIIASTIAVVKTTLDETLKLWAVKRMKDLESSYSLSDF